MLHCDVYLLLTAVSAALVISVPLVRGRRSSVDIIDQKTGKSAGNQPTFARD